MEIGKFQIAASALTSAKRTMGYSEKYLPKTTAESIYLKKTDAAATYFPFKGGTMTGRLTAAATVDGGIVIPGDARLFTQLVNGSSTSLLYRAETTNDIMFGNGNVAIQMAGTSFVPNNNGGKALGGVSNRWSTLFAVHGDFSGKIKVGETVNNGLVSQNGNMLIWYYPESSAVVLANGSGSILAHTQTFRPNSNGTASLGTASARWGTVYSVTGDFSGGVKIGDAQSLSAQNGVTLIQYTSGWDAVRLSNGAKSVVINAPLMHPEADNTSSLGATTRRWANLYAGTGNFSSNISLGYIQLSTENVTSTRTGGLRLVNTTSGGEAILYVDGYTKTVFPEPTNTVNLGTVSRIWKAVYATNGTIQTSARKAKEHIARVKRRTDIDAAKKVGKRKSQGISESVSDISAEDVVDLCYLMRDETHTFNMIPAEGTEITPESLHIGTIADSIAPHKAFKYIGVKIGKDDFGLNALDVAVAVNVTAVEAHEGVTEVKANTADISMQLAEALRRIEKLEGKAS